MSNPCVMEPGAWPPVKSAQLNSISTVHALRVAYVETDSLATFLQSSPSTVLGVVYHERSDEQSNRLGAYPVICLDIPQFNGPSLAEVWTSTLPLTYHHADGIHCAMNDEFLFGALQLHESPGTLLDTVTYTAYRRLLAKVRALGYPHLLRVWN
jgi:chorismate lyase / 3-hydroxybenzoate synthase